MATYNIDFGVKTRSGCGAPTLAGTLSGSISGTGAADWALTAGGSIAPSGTYLAYIAFSKSAGQTYNLTVGSDTVNITLVANAAHVATPATDTATSNQLRTLLGLAYNANGALRVGDTVYFRDGSVYDFQAAGLTGSITLPTSGYGGFGEVTTPGNGYTSGIYPVTGGSGTNGRLYILTSGGSVVHAAVMDPGDGNYAASDVISVTADGGSDFTFTVTDFNALITIRSETANATTVHGGNARRGGDATLTNLILNPGSTAPRAPIHLRYLDWKVIPGVTRNRQTFFSYRDPTNGYGIAVTDCYAYVPDEVTITSLTDTDRIIAFACRLGNISRNTFYRVRRAIERVEGPGTKTSGGLMRADDTVMRDTIADNILIQLNGDGIKVKGRKRDVTGNFYRDPEQVEVPPDTPGAHMDFFQFDLGDLEAGVLYDADNYIADNVVWIGAAGNEEPQGAIFFSDPADLAELGGVTIENNAICMSAQNAIAVPAGVNPTIRRNTCVNLVDWPGDVDSSTSRIFLKEGEGGLVDLNMAGQVTTTSPDGDQIGVDVTARNTLLGSPAATYAGLPSLTYSECLTKAQVLAKIRPLEGLAVASLGAMNTDGTYNGKLFPDGTENDGTVYQATPPSSITQSAPASEMTVGGDLVITYQLDAAANQVVTITPGVSGVSGSFSAATVTIGVGEASTTVTFTPTTAGTATLSATDDRSLTGPSNITVTVNSAAVSPTAYTQAADRASVSLGGSIRLTYTLNQPAVLDVTITPAVSGVLGAFSSPTVTITSGQTTGTVDYFPASIGTASFTTSDNRSLTDPAAVEVTVSPISRGKLRKLMRV